MASKIKVAKEKKPTLKSLQLRILILEGEKVSLQNNARNQHNLIDGLVAALRPFSFPKELSAFRGTASNFTPCHIADADVQRAREVINVRDYNYTS